MKEEYVAPREYVDALTGKIAAYVPAVCEWKSYNEGRRKPHKVAFYWDWDGSEVSKPILENVSHATIYDEEGLTTIRKVVEKLNDALLREMLNTKGNKSNSEVIDRHNRDIEFAMHVAQKHIKDDILGPIEPPINLFSRD